MMSKKKVLMLYQYDDAGAEHFSRIISRHHECKIFRFGQSEERYGVDLDRDNFKITNNEEYLTKDDFVSASLIYFRLWRMDRLNAVQSSLNNDESALFSEREWFSVFQSVLFLAESCTESTKWINPPSIELKSRSKPYLLCRASSYINVLDFNVSVEINASRFNSPVAAKCISVNQKYGKNRYYRTSILDTKLLEALPARQSTPAFLTEYIKPNSEARVYYFLGDITAIRLKSVKDYVDIRDLRNTELVCDKIDLPKHLHEAVIRFCNSEKFNYCCFDFIEKNGEFHLIDITPNGTWDFYDSLVEFEISNMFATAINRSLN